jgi:hypothetical protein
VEQDHVREQRHHREGDDARGRGRHVVGAQDASAPGANGARPAAAGTSSATVTAVRARTPLPRLASASRQRAWRRRRWRPARLSDSTIFTAAEEAGHRTARPEITSSSTRSTTSASAPLMASGGDARNTTDGMIGGAT